MASQSSVNLTFEQIKQGNLKSFEGLFRSRYSELTNYAYKFVRQQEIAEEIVQDVFTYLWEKRAQINIQSSLDSYLYAATKNKSLNYIKHELPKQQAQVDIDHVLADIEEKDGIDEIPDLVKKYVDQAIEDLPGKCKEIFILSRYEGLTYDEIATEMEISKKTVENQMGIALKKLRESLRPIINRLLSKD